ncbi:MAG: hypothetical protein DRG24_09745 [Epsilonproteobacteria bacterium]|nr:MAG: hypothetical protein DRG24_09745 [Campylobacterota bacterium]
MKVLLLNDNPIIDKLVTLSAQKRGDDLVKVFDNRALEAGRYDLLVIDESSASSHLPSDTAIHMEYGYTLFIATRATAVPDMYDQILYKPFLPMEMLGIFKKAEEIAVRHTEELLKTEETVENEELEASFLLDTPFDNDDLIPDVTIQSVLKNVDIHEVQGLLDDVENDEDSAIRELKEVVQHPDTDSDITDLEAQINQALEALSQEDLMQTVDEEILFDSSTEIYASEEEPSIWDTIDHEDEMIDESSLSESSEVTEEIKPTVPDNKGAQALQEIFRMLADPEIANSLHSMNVSIKISFGEKQ